MSGRLRLQTLGPALRLLREERNHRQQSLAEQAGVTLSMVSAFENTNRFPSLRSLEGIPNALDARLADLVAAVERVERQ